MSDATDAQLLATYNAKGQALPSTVAPKSGDSIVETLVSGTSFQISATRGAHLYINVRTAASLVTAIGPDSSAGIVLDAAQSDAIGMTTLWVPAGWYVKLTGTMANLVLTAVLS